MSLININHLTFYYEGSSKLIFDNVSLQIDTDWKLGLVARNGRGKTTLLKLLQTQGKNFAGGEKEKYEYRGSIVSSEEFDYFPFSVRDPKRNTVDIAEEMYPGYEFWKLCRELNLLQVNPDVLYRPFFTLSSGEQTKVMLAVLFSMEEKFLLIDEPANHLDMNARNSVKEYLKGKKGFILVSHDRDFLDECVNHILAINKTNIEVYQGNFSSWWEQRKKQETYELSENERLKKDINRLKESAGKARQWADHAEATKIGKKSIKNGESVGGREYIGEKSRRMQMRRKNLERRREKEIEQKSQLLKNMEIEEDLKLFCLRHHKDRIVSLRDVQIYFGDKKLKSLSFDILNGDRIALQGQNGCGKSSFIKVILQEAGKSVEYRKIGETEKGKGNSPMVYSGRIQIAPGLIISYVPQDSSFLMGDLIQYGEMKGLDIPIFLSLLRKLDFEREQFEKNMRDYSAGQKKKVLLAASLCERAHLYVWDEPLNYIDVFSRMQLEELLNTFRPTLLMVEHDKGFVEKICDKMIDCE